MAKSIVEYDPEEVLDRTVDAAMLASWVRSETPFCHLRYGDGEFHSLLGRKGKNCDGHNYMSGTMGKELAGILREVGGLFPDNIHIPVGLHITWNQANIQRWVKDEGLIDRVRWVNNIILQTGLEDLSTLELLKACRDYHRDFTIVVGNKAVAPAADLLQAFFVEIPNRNAYTSIDTAADMCQRLCLMKTAAGPYPRTLILASAGIPCECLLWRLWKMSNGNAMLIDTGHILDMLVGRKTRRYTRKNKGGIMDLIRDVYLPELAGSRAMWC